jgi:hypothetical protein
MSRSLPACPVCLGRTGPSQPDKELAISATPQGRELRWAASMALNRAAVRLASAPAARLVAVICGSISSRKKAPISGLNGQPSEIPRSQSQEETESRHCEEPPGPRLCAARGQAPRRSTLGRGALRAARDCFATLAMTAPRGFHPLRVVVSRWRTRTSRRFRRCAAGTGPTRGRRRGFLDRSPIPRPILGGAVDAQDFDCLLPDPVDRDVRKRREYELTRTGNSTCAPAMGRVVECRVGIKQGFCDPPGGVRFVLPDTADDVLEISASRARPADLHQDGKVRSTAAHTSSAGTKSPLSAAASPSAAASAELIAKEI